MYQAACTTLRTRRNANRYRGLSFSRSGLPYPPLMIQARFCEGGEKYTNAWQNQNAETMCQRKIVAGTRGCLARAVIVIQLEGVHRRPILKVLRGIMKMIRLVIQNRAALKPAGPKGKRAQNKEETLAGGWISNGMETVRSTYYTSLRRQQKPRDAIRERLLRRAASECAILMSGIFCMPQVWVRQAHLSAFCCSR